METNVAPTTCPAQVAKTRKASFRLDIVSQLRREMELTPEKLLDFASRTNVTAAATFRAAP